MTPRKTPPKEKFNSDSKNANFPDFSPFSEIRPKYQEKAFLLGNNSLSLKSFMEGESHLGFSENQSMMSFNSRFGGFGMNGQKSQFMNYKSQNTVVRFNRDNSNQMPERLRNKYFSYKVLKKNLSSSMSSSSFTDDLHSLSGIICGSIVKKKTEVKLIGVDWTSNLYNYRKELKQHLVIPEELSLQIHSSTLQNLLNSLRFIEEGQNLPYESELDVDNEKLGYILMLLSMDNQQGSPGIFSMLLIQAFKTSSNEVRKSIFDSLCRVLKSEYDSQLDEVHKKLISDVLFVIFLEDKDLFLKDNIAELLFEKGINHLAFIVMGEILANGIPKKISTKRRLKRIKKETRKNLCLNVTRQQLDKVGINAEKYFRLCELLGLKQEKWGLYESLFESEKKAIQLLKLKENKYYLPFVNYIEKNPEAFKSSFNSQV
jgi:hypothetical protein